MKFNIRTQRIPDIDPAAVERALTERDPAAVIDFDKAAALLRLSTCLDDRELLALMAEIGLPIPASDLVGVPSECCGGCGG